MNSADRYMPLILGALVFAALPYLFWLPVWIVLWCLACWGFALQVSQHRWPAPRARTRRLLILVGLLGVPALFGGQFSGDLFIGLLAIMASLKPLEVRTRRDRMVTVFLAYFLVLTNLFYNDSLTMALYLLTSVCLTTAVLIAVNQPAPRLTCHLKLSATLTVQALPLAVALFLVFPRAGWHFWGGYQQAGAQSGFSDYLAPGSFAHLARDPAIAFRVDFENEIPSRERLYWRGIVFWRFTGRQWVRGDAAPGRRSLLSGGEPVRYTVSLEPHGKKWWFALDLPLLVSRYVQILGDFTLFSRRPVRERIIYSARSYTTYHTGPLSPLEAAALNLPPGGNPRAQGIGPTLGGPGGNARRHRCCGPQIF